MRGNESMSRRGDRMDKVEGRKEGREGRTVKHNPRSHSFTHTHTQTGTVTHTPGICFYFTLCGQHLGSIRLMIQLPSIHCHTLKMHQLIHRQSFYTYITNAHTRTQAFNFPPVQQNGWKTQREDFCACTRPIPLISTSLALIPSPGVVCVCMCVCVCVCVCVSIFVV